VEAWVNQKEIDQAKSQVAKSLEAKLSHRGGFAKQMRRAKRHLPRKLLKQADIISQAEENLKHPRMRKLVDRRAVAKAKRNLMQAADKMDPTAERSRFWYNWGSNLIINLVLGMVVIYGLSKWLSSG
jgi:hypothetical protein